MNFNIDDNFYELSCIELSRWYSFDKIFDNDDNLNNYFERLFKIVNWIIKNYGILTKPYNKKNYNSIKYFDYSFDWHEYIIYTYEILLLERETGIKIIDDYGVLWRMSNRIGVISGDMDYASKIQQNSHNYKTNHIFIKKIILIYGKY
jgi:hypothetical protein